ncbi:MAG: hypothetical protein ABI333_18745 [bacterium]
MRRCTLSILAGLFVVTLATACKQQRAGSEDRAAASMAPGTVTPPGAMEPTAPRRVDSMAAVKPAVMGTQPVRPRPVASNGLRLGPIPADADLGPEARRLFDALFCRGRKIDRPCTSLNEAVALYRKNYLAPMRAWLAKRMPQSLPMTLLYPFSGADLLSALSVYPAQRQYVHLSLEHGGPPVSLAEMKPFVVSQARFKFTWMARLLLASGESFSVDLQKQEQAGLPGTLPLFLMGLYVHGGVVTGLSYLRVTPAGRLERYTRKELSATGPRARRHFFGWKNPRFSKRYSNLELRFRLPGEAQERSIIHIAANLANKGLAARPGVAKLLGSLGPKAVMIKAASWLMWGNEFSRIRELIFHGTQFAITDVSAPYPAWLRKNGFKVETYGRFECMPKKKMHVMSLGWRFKFRRPTSRALPFRYGYVDCKKHNHLVLLRRSPGAPALKPKIKPAIKPMAKSAIKPMAKPGTGPTPPIKPAIKH